MRGPELRPIVIAAGGTGGHFYPAEALAAALIARGQWVVLMTDARSGALNSTVFKDRDQYVLPGAGIAGRGVARAGKAVLALAAGMVKARGILARIRPAAVVAFGGYPAVPPVLATRLLRDRPPVILHEQNAVLGRANRFLCGHASVLALSFAATTRVPQGVRTVVTGNPARPAIMALSTAPYTPPYGLVHLLILGGSLGARVFSDIVPEALTRLPDALRARLRVTQQCRAEDLDRVCAAYRDHGIAADLAPFFPDVADRLRGAHLVIARAGASTVAELAIAGRPAILVPLPGAIDGHQSANARALADAGGAWVMPQPTFTAARLADSLARLLADNAAPGASDSPLARAAAGARSVAQVGAADALAGLVQQLARQEIKA